MSIDGLHWEKPELDVEPGTNIVKLLTRGSETVLRDSNTVWLDHCERDPERRFKMFTSHRGEDGELGLGVFFSPDGIHWSEQLAMSGPMGDRSTVFYNPFRKVWVVQHQGQLVRPAPTVSGERRCARGSQVDPSRRRRCGSARTGSTPGAKARTSSRNSTTSTPWPTRASCSVCSASGTAAAVTTAQKPNHVSVAFSRDGFHWHRPYREAFVPISEQPGDWNYGNVQSAGGCCLVVKDRLYFYVSGRSGIPGSNSKTSGTCCTGLATLRRDGFASMEAGDEEERLTTRPIQFTGKHLFVNVDAPDGELRAEVLDLDHERVRNYTRDDCVPIQTDSTCVRVEWKHGGDLSEFAGKPIRLRFHLRNGGIYAFWVSPDESGASHGYLAAGGPGFTEPTDTVGLTGY